MGEDAGVTGAGWYDPPVSWVEVAPGGPVPPAVAGWLYPVLFYLRQAVAHDDGSGDLRLDDAFGIVPSRVLDAVDAVFETDALPDAVINSVADQDAGLRLINAISTTRLNSAAEASAAPNPGAVEMLRELQRLVPPTGQRRGGPVDPGTPDGRRIFELFLRVKLEVEQPDENWPGGDVVDLLTAWLSEVGLSPDAPVADLLETIGCDPEAVSPEGHSR